MTALQATAKANVEAAAGNLMREMLRSIPIGDARLGAIVMLTNTVRLAIDALAQA